jgi:hypothetical protein
MENQIPNPLNAAPTINESKGHSFKNKTFVYTLEISRLKEKKYFQIKLPKGLKRITGVHVSTNISDF